jgi:hypothetical protein
LNPRSWQTAVLLGRLLVSTVPHTMLPSSPNAAGSSVPRPRRVTIASGKLLDASNSAAPTLTSHKHAIEAKRADDAAKQASHQIDVAASAPSSPVAAVQPVPSIDDDADTSDFEREKPSKCFIYYTWHLNDS